MRRSLCCSHWIWAWNQAFQIFSCLKERLIITKSRLLFVKTTQIISEMLIVPLTGFSMKDVGSLEQGNSIFMSQDGNNSWSRSFVTLIISEHDNNLPFGRHTLLLNGKLSFWIWLVVPSLENLVHELISTKIPVRSSTWSEQACGYSK